MVYVVVCVYQPPVFMVAWRLRLVVVVQQSAYRSGRVACPDLLLSSDALVE